MGGVHPADVLARWFAAHRAGELDAARALLRDDALIVVPGARLAGFDELMSWYAQRSAAEGPDFGYAVVDVLAGEHHAAAILAMRNGSRHWRQVAVYTVKDDRIAAIRAYEDDAEDA